MALVPILLAACGSSSNGADGTTTTTTAKGAATTSPASGSTVGTTATTGTTAMPGTSADQQVIIDAYLNAMAAFDQATADPPNPDHPALAATTIDPVLTQVRNLAASWKGFGQALRYPPNSVHKITPLTVQIDGETATIETCNVDDGVLYEPATGRVVNDKVSTAHDRATMKRVDGVWKLSTREQVQKWEGVAGCASSAS